MLKSNFIAKNKKVEIQKIKIEEINDPWLWNYKPNYNNLIQITENLNNLYDLLEN